MGKPIIVLLLLSSIASYKPRSSDLFSPRGGDCGVGTPPTPHGMVSTSPYRLSLSVLVVALALVLPER